MKKKDQPKTELPKDLAELQKRIAEMEAENTKLKRAESELRKFSAAIEHSTDIVFITDNKGDIEYVNPVFEEVTGYSREEAIGQTLHILASGVTTYSRLDEMWITINAGHPWQGKFKNKKSNGDFFWAKGIISPLKDEKGEITHFLSVQEDITGRKVSEEKVEYLTSHDGLTGLVNRSRFIELLDGWLFKPKNRNRTGVLFLINMDEFKFINNTYGYGFGDEFLRWVARALESAMEDMERESIVGRLGGNEFVPYGHEKGMDEKIRMLVAEGIRKRLEWLRSGDVPGRSTASIGVVFYPEHATAAKELLTKADAAMYRAKELGRNRCYLYRSEDRLVEKMHSRVEWKERIVKALEEDRIEPWFQPILNLKNNKVYYYEALTRMRDDKDNIFLPASFIEIAERFGLISSIDMVLIEKTMGQQAELNRRGSPITFSMNLSGKDLGDEEFLSFLKFKISATGADPERLVFEITETAAVHNIERAIRFIEELKSMGCHFALDDFGVGFSSFVYLKKLKVDYVKLDGSFVKRLHKDTHDQLFVKAMIDVARGMKIKTIAEHVESEDTLKLLKEYRVDYAQGFHIGKPMPLQSLNAL
jgi:diguanylate cyclase (GGDEF)-like protein/PAS domain S-box-containing protein